MNVPQDELDLWAEVAERVNSLLVAAQDAFRVEDTAAARERVDDARVRVARLLKALVRNGASEPAPSRTPSYDVPLSLLTSETAQAYACALRKAAELAVAVDKERGWYPDGPADIVSDWAEEAEYQAFGPRELR